MPLTFYYECRACGATMSAQQKITDVALVDCPRCEKPALRRLIVRGADFILKGSGWEKDGYS